MMRYEVPDVTVVRCGSVWWLVELNVFVFWVQRQSERPRIIFGEL